MFILLNFSQISTLPANFPNSEDPAPIPEMPKRNTVQENVKLHQPVHISDLIKVEIKSRLFQYLSC